MRRATALRSVSRENPGTVKNTSGTSRSAETSAVIGAERSILSTLRDMERMMEESFHRPFFGMNSFPLRHLFREMGSFGDITPSIDIFEEKGEVVVKAELPGMKRDDITVKLVDNRVIIAGEKKSEETISKEDYQRLERSYGSFNRTLVLPEAIDSDHAKASFRDGVLEIRIPKVAEGKAVHNITVK